MAGITLSLTQDELSEAVRDWVEKKGFLTTDRFSVRVTTHKGDRPFDPDYTEVSVSGVAVREATRP
jgi:hypothetical protein